MADGDRSSQLDARTLLKVLRALRKGDFSARLPSDLTGIDGEIAGAFNDVVELNSGLVREFERLARTVGKEGRISERARLPGAQGGGWSDCVESINGMVGDLLQPTSEVARVIGAVAKGDLSQTMQLEIDGRPLRGEFLRIGKVVNTMVGQLASFASEVTRVAKEVGTDGKLGGQAEVKGVAGTWKDLTDNVNMMAANLTGQVRNIAEVTTAVANGDLSKKITVDVKGEMLELKNTINTMVDQLNSFASEVTRVAREVGSEGKLGGQADVRGVAGTWKDLTDNVNMMAANLTGQVRGIAEVVTAVADGNLTRKLSVDAKGEIAALADTINNMIGTLATLAEQVTNVAREVGIEGKLGGQARVPGAAGLWRDLADNVNMMAANLTGQVRNIADVTTAVANGDLSRKITVDVRGEMLELKSTINTMVDQLNSFANEVTRVAREVGTEGKLGGQAEVQGVGGVWKGLTDNVNLMAANLTGQVRGIAEVVTAVATGDLSKKITVDVKGEMLELKNTINTMVDRLNSFASEVTRVAREVGTEGRLGGQADVKGVAGTWKDLTDNVNMMAANLTGQVRNIAEVTKAVAMGDLSKQITVDVRGEMLELKSTMNTMVDQLNSFASEVTRVAREVGTEGKLGGQAEVKGVSGLWQDLTDNVNMMAANLTGQVRNIADVTTAVANGDLSKKITVDVKGEMLELKSTVNTMVDQLNSFASEVTRVAREVGSEGKLGGQARVEGVSGMWRDLTDNVNQLAANLTTQVRAIADVATAVTRGDLTRSVTAEALGELAALKDNINAMIRNLRDQTEKNAEQDWLKTNLARFTRMLQGERDLTTVTDRILSELAPLVGAQRGVFYMVEPSKEEGPVLQLVASYAFTERKSLANRFRLREGLVGQCAYEKKRILLTSVPGDYITIGSALGEAPPLNIIVLPVLFEEEVKAVIELASFNRFSETHQSFLDQLTESIGIVLNTIGTNTRTETLLAQSQLLTAELQSQQAELKTTNDRLEQQAASLRASEELLKSQQERLKLTNEELEEKARLLEIQKGEVETKNREVSVAKGALEEKAEQLALTSRYKSQFLANMSHELRTPLNSLLILSKLLSDNPQGNLNEKQLEFSKTIHAAGMDLLALINEILDLSKVESGTVELEIGELSFGEMTTHLERTFRQVAEERDLEFTITLDPALPKSIRTDSKRLLQILRNLLANAFKFTERGSVNLAVTSAEGSLLRSGADWLAFAVTDTGIGIAEEKQRIVFEAFQQADGTTSRQYGGTGLGLSISREIARLLGGEIVVESAPGKGSTFTLFVPLAGPPAAAAEGRPLRSESVPSGRARLGNGGIVQPADDRQRIASGDQIVLIVEDDPTFASVVLELAREKGFRGLVAPDGASALALANRYSPHAITLDIGLPDMDGWALLDMFKRDPRTRDIPIHVITVGEREKRAADAEGGGLYLEKPVDRDALLDALSRTSARAESPVNRLLLVEDDEIQRRSIEALLEKFAVTSVASAEGALAAIDGGRFDCAVVDLGLPDLGGMELIRRIRALPDQGGLPIIVYTGQDLSADVERILRDLGSTVIVKGAGSPERLLDETAMFLHRALHTTAPIKRAEPREDVFETDLEGRKVLIVDDDMRNIFSLTSALESQGVEAVFAESGPDAIRRLDSDPSIDAALIDIMMPGMDGYAAIRAIRAKPQHADLPLIAVTAKAMVGDREKCLESGASDYISKPVDIGRLFAALRAQLHQAAKTRLNGVDREPAAATARGAADAGQTL